MESILYVDDEQVLLEIGKMYLEMTNEFEVITANSASFALNLIKTCKFQAIVSDYQMPMMNGIEFLKAVRLTDKVIPFIIFSGRGRDEIAIEAFENGANFYLQKGGSPHPQYVELMLKIQSAIDHRRADSQVLQLNKMYSVLSATNKAIIHIHKKNELLNEICRFSVDVGGFKGVCASFFDGLRCTLEPVASYGDFDAYLERELISSDAGSLNNGQIRTVLRENSYHFCNDIATDQRMLSGHDTALGMGYRSLAVFPFGINTLNPGVLTFYSSEPGIFNDQIIGLLKEQSDDISFALVNLDHEEQRITTEKDLASSELKYRRLFETAQDAILILDGDTGTIIDANKFIMDLLGYPLDYFIGKHLWELGFIKDKSLALNAFKELKTKGYIRYENLPLETDLGKVNNVEFISNVYYVGDKRIIQCNIRDISDRKEAQDLLQISETRYHRLFETSYDGILILDEETEMIIDANPSILKLLGYPLDNIVGKHLWQLGFFKDKDLAQKTLHDLKKNGYLRYDNLPMETKDGRSISVEFVSNVYLVNLRKIIQCDIRDITLREESESNISLTSRKLSFLSSITHHDIFNQITILLGYLERSQEINPGKEILEFIRKEIVSVETILKIICFANDYEKMGINSPVWHTLSTIVREITSSLPIEGVTVTLDDHDAEIFGDILLKKVFFNLVENSLRYGGDQLNRISFFVEENDKGLAIVVEDNGVGIEEKDKKHLFMRGFGKQSGLGLFLCREILSITGVTISENGISGRGARFEIFVPKGGYRFVI